VSISVVMSVSVAVFVHMFPRVVVGLVYERVSTLCVWVGVCVYVGGDVGVCGCVCTYVSDGGGRAGV